LETGNPIWISLKIFFTEDQQHPIASYHTGS
jgi:hypothetical protein